MNVNKESATINGRGFKSWYIDFFVKVDLDEVLLSKSV
jgi:hypothetical protein